MIKLLLIIGVAVLAVILLAVMFFVAGAILTAWTYAKSPQARMAEELEDNGTIEGWIFTAYGHRENRQTQEQQ